MDQETSVGEDQHIQSTKSTTCRDIEMQLDGRSETRGDVVSDIQRQ